MSAVKKLKAKSAPSKAAKKAAPKAGAKSGAKTGTKAATKPTAAKPGKKAAPKSGGVIQDTCAKGETEVKTERRFDDLQELRALSLAEG